MKELASSEIQVALIELKKTSIETYMDRSEPEVCFLPANQEGSHRFTYRTAHTVFSFLDIITTLLGVILFCYYLLSISVARSYSPFIICERMATWL